MAIWLGWGARRKYDHRPHAKRARGSSVWRQIKTNWEALSGAGSPRLPRMPNAWCRRGRPFRTGKWKLQARGTDQGNSGCRPVYQFTGKNGTRSLTLTDRPTRFGGRPAESLNHPLIRCFVNRQHPTTLRNAHPDSSRQGMKLSRANPSRRVFCDGW
jgi:hypothetical protein